MSTRVMGVTIALVIASVAAAAAAAGEGKSRLMTGTIVGVDAKAMALTVRNEIQGGDAEVLHLAVESGATIRIHGLKGKLDQLKPGDVVTVRYSEKEGALRVTEIQHM